MNKLVLSIALASALPLTTHASLGRAAILQEVQDQLSQAQRCLNNGSGALAMAHSKMILVSDDIAYAVKFDNGTSTSRGAAMHTLHDALATWQAVLKGTVRFHQIDDSSKADIVVRFEPDVRMGEEQVAGYANWKRIVKTDAPASSSFSALLQIRTRLPDLEPMPSAAMKHEIMHEMGHILGLEDSERVGDLMGPLDVNHPVTAPKPYESEAVYDLRSQADSIRKQAQAAQNRS